MRKRYYLSFDMDDPRHREAERLFSQQANRQRTDFVVSSILAAAQTERLEQLVRQAVREELQNLQCVNQAAGQFLQLNSRIRRQCLRDF